MVDQATWSGDHDLHAVTQVSNLSALRHASVHDGLRGGDVPRGVGERTIASVTIRKPHKSALIHLANMSKVKYSGENLRF